MTTAGLFKRMQDRRAGYQARNTPTEANLDAHRGRVPRPYRPSSTTHDFFSEAMRSAAMKKRSHGREQGSPAGSGNPLGNYPRYPGGKRQQLAVVGDPQPADAAESKSPEQRMGDLLKSIGPLIPRPDGSKLGFISREASGLPGRSPVSVKRRDDGGLEFGPAEPLSAERRKGFRDQNLARNLAGRSGEPLRTDGEELVDAITRHREAIREQRGRQADLSRVMRLGHNARRYQSKPLRDAYSTAMQDYRQWRPDNGGSPRSRTVEG